MAHSNEMNRRLAKNANRNIAFYRAKIATLEEKPFSPFTESVKSNFKKRLADEISDLTRYLKNLKLSERLCREVEDVVETETVKEKNDGR